MCDCFYGNSLNRDFSCVYEADTPHKRIETVCNYCSGDVLGDETVV